MSEAIWSEACSSTPVSDELFCHWEEDSQLPEELGLDASEIRGFLPDLGREANELPPPLDDDHGGVATVWPSTC